MLSIWEIANQNNIKSYIQKHLGDPWVGTPFQGYRQMGNKQKGEYGEQIVREYFLKLNRHVEKPDSPTAGHDLKVDGLLVEIKFSLSHTDTQKNIVKENCFTMNHVAIGKDWDRLVFVGVNNEDSKTLMKFISKEDFIKLKETDEFWDYFGIQQGGKNSNNDDFISSEKRLYKFLTSGHVKDITEWT